MKVEGRGSDNTEPLYTHQDGHNKKRWTITNAGNDVEKSGPPYMPLVGM